MYMVTQTCFDSLLEISREAFAGEHNSSPARSISSHPQYGIKKIWLLLYPTCMYVHHIIGHAKTSANTNIVLQTKVLS